MGDGPAEESQLNAGEEGRPPEVGSSVDVTVSPRAEEEAAAHPTAQSKPHGWLPGKWGWWVLVGLTLVGAALRLHNITAENLWIDEVFSLMVANGHLYPEVPPVDPMTAADMVATGTAWQPLTWDNLMAMLEKNVHMPLYYMLLNPWLGWLGNTTWGLRSFSCLFSVLLIPLTMAMVWRVSGSWRFYKLTPWLGVSAGAVATVVTGWLTVFSPFQLYFAQEGRMYTLALFWAVTSSWLLWEWFHGRDRTQVEDSLEPVERNALEIWDILPSQWLVLVGYTLAAFGGLFTHYTFVYILVFQAVYGVSVLAEEYKTVVAQGSGRWQMVMRHHLALLIPAGVLLAAGLAWLPVYEAQKAYLAGQWHFSKGLMGIERYLTMLIWEPLNVVAGDNHGARTFWFPVTLLILVVGGLALMVRWVFWPKMTHSPATDVDTNPLSHLRPRMSREGFFLLWCLEPIVISIILDLVQETHTTTIVRYTMLIAPGVYGLLGVLMVYALEGGRALLGCGWFYRQWLQPLTQSLLVVSVMGSILVGYLTVHDPSPLRWSSKSGMGEVAAYLKDHAQQGDVLVMNGVWGITHLAAFYIAPEVPTLPMLHWSKTYGPVKNIPLPSEDLFQCYGRVWYIRHRSNQRRGAEELPVYLRQFYPNVRQIKGVPEKLWVYEREKP